MADNLNKKLYNEKIKNMFIEKKQGESNIPKEYLLNMFRKASEYEYESEKDICDWTSYDIIEYYKMINTASLEVLFCLNSMFSQYTQFCIENNLVKDNQNHYLECNYEILKGCINKAILNKKIVNRETILEWIQELPNPKDRFILLGVFEFGKSNDYKDIVYARQDGVNGNTLKLTNRVVNISDDLLNIIIDCCEEDKYYSISDKQVKVMPLIDYGYIVKNYPNQGADASDYQKGRNVYISSRRIMNFLGVGSWMSLNAISESGKLYMINRRAKELGISARDYIYSDAIKEVEDQYNCTITKSIYAKKYSEYLV